VPDKFAVARALLEIAALYRLTGKGRFQARAFEGGALAVESSQDLGRLVDEGRLTELAGVGPTLARQIADLWLTGRSDLLERLRSEVPTGAVELSSLPSMTIKRIRALHAALGIQSLEDLRAACERQLLRTVPGFGPKTEQRLCEALRAYDAQEDDILLTDALATAERLLGFVRAGEGVLDVRLAGAARRYHETVKELVLVVSSRDRAATLRHVSQFPSMARFDVEAQRGRIAGGMTLEIDVAEPEHFGTALVRATGSGRHVALLEALAEARGTSLFPENTAAPLLRAATEPELYAALGLGYVPPELREGRAELQQAEDGDVQRGLLELADVRGLIHCHTVYSDGKNTIEEMARAAESLGMAYITITDHSPSAFYAGGLDVERLKRQWDEIAEVQERVNVRILRGTESDILADGALDFPDAVIEQLDVVIASIHSRLRMDREQMTERLVRCMKLPVFKIWGHALGRIVLRRPPIDCDVEAVLDAAAASRAAIEINSDPYRLDLAPEWLIQARARNIPFVVSTDAHSVRGLRVLHYGVGLARRAGIRQSEVLNTLGPAEFAAAVKP
jgi:DNA polymerase (family 10)